MSTIVYNKEPRVVYNQVFQVSSLYYFYSFLLTIPV